jgi:crotonobetainyl-CoA:carnitine CoA-transferase CaiB-like acyl-CoA transferase
VDRNKRSVALDLRDPRGVQIVERLATTCALLVESFRPGVAERLGVGYEALRAVNPALVYCSLSGFGASGPLAGEAAHDLNYVGRAGLVGLGGADGQPSIPGTQVADLGGSLMCVAGMLAALLAAERTGRGDHVDVSLTDSAFALLSTALAPYFATGRVPGTATELLTGGYPCYQLYRCRDGRTLTVGALEPQFWSALCAAVGRPELEPTHFDPDAVPVWRELFAARPLQEWLELLGERPCRGDRRPPAAPPRNGGDAR